MKLSHLPVLACILSGLAACSGSDADESFLPTWDSLSRYEQPSWFQETRFGIFAHWGPQCQPEQGDWYAQHMYNPSKRQGIYHREHYGDPGEFGFVAVADSWKAENWNPDSLVALYRRMGATYVMAMANHHDNMDLWDSEHPFNSVAMGPHRNIIGEWEQAVRKAGLRFGVTVHAANSWRWYYIAREYDALRSDEYRVYYAQNFDPPYDPATPRSRKAWAPDAFRQYFKQRTLDLISRYRPDLVYFDDTVLPFYPFFDEGLEMAADYYNMSEQWNGGHNQAVLFGKRLHGEQRQALVNDLETSLPPEPLYPRWQTDICIGDWHYDRRIYEEDRYKSAAQVLQILVDVVSKNGNLCLSVPIRGDGSLDEKERAICEDVASWMAVNRDVIYGTEVCKVFGEGPQVENAPQLSDDTFNFSQILPATAEDIRYLQSRRKKNLVYAVVLAPSEGEEPEFAALGAAGLRIRNIKKRDRIKDLPQVYELKIR